MHANTNLESEGWCCGHNAEKSFSIDGTGLMVERLHDAEIVLGMQGKSANERFLHHLMLIYCLHLPLPVPSMPGVGNDSQQS